MRKLYRTWGQALISNARHTFQGTFGMCDWVLCVDGIDVESVARTEKLIALGSYSTPKIHLVFPPLQFKCFIVPLPFVMLLLFVTFHSKQTRNGMHRTLEIFGSMSGQFFSSLIQPQSRREVADSGLFRIYWRSYCSRKLG